MVLRAPAAHPPLTTHELLGATHGPWRSLNDGLGAAAALAAAVQRDVAIGDVEGDPCGEPADGAFERVVLEGGEPAAAIADQVRVMLVVMRALWFVAGDAVTDVDAREQPEREKLVEPAVDRGAAEAAAFAAAQFVLNVQRRERAGLVFQQFDDHLPSAAGPVAGV